MDTANDKRTEIPDEVKNEIRTRKIEFYRNSAYDAELDYKVGVVLNDEAMKTAAQERIKKCLKAIEVLSAPAA